MNKFLRSFAKLRALLFCCGLAFVLTVPVQAQGITPADQQIWDRYVNPRFGIVSDVPRIGFYAQVQPDNSDGQSYLSADGDTEFTVFGNYWNTDAERFEDYRQARHDFLINLGADITYAPSGDNWFVFSGFLGDQIFYLKAATRSGCAIAGHIYFLYPAEQREVMSSLVERMEDSLRLAASADCSTI